MNMNEEIDDNVSSNSTISPPYLPPSMLEKRVNWDVFLSFRGEDTRADFTTKLRDTLESKGLRPFMDDEGMQKGDTIQPTLEEAIVDSALAVAIISPRYADSRWCLDELRRIFECRKRVIPVFYYVDPSHVRRQRGVFGDGFKMLINDESKKFKDEIIQSWRNALDKVGNISGYTCESKSDESKAIQCIVQQVWKELKNSPEYVVRVAVGLDSRVDKVVSMLDLDSMEVRFLGIHGTPGIGKTTLAKAVYNKLVVHFRNRCFISNVRDQLANEGGILSVQNELIRKLSLGSVRAVEQEGAAKSVIKRIVQENRVLVVLDDVFEAEQIEKLGIVRRWFDQGSRIIVTSRNVNALLKFARNDDELYEAEKLDDLESEQLFSVHALGRQEPTPEFKDVSKEIVSLTGGLPLALEVFGSFLVKKTVKEWKDAVMKLRVNRPPSLQQVLELSYDGLDEQEKTVFLDISCLFLQLDMKREDIIDVLAGCDLRAELAVGKLVERSLLKIRERNELWMHDQIRDMGRQIVIEQSCYDVKKQSRLWDFVDTMSVLRKEKVTEAVRGIVLDIKKPPDFTDAETYWFSFRRHPNIRNFVKYLEVRFNGLTSRHRLDKDDNSILHTRWFEKSMHLKLLQMDYAKLQGDFDYMPSELRWLRWKGCSLKTLANIPEELRVLDLSWSKIERLWSSDCLCGSFNKVVGKLVVINLSNCPRLTALPDMSGHKHLKKLILEHCVGLTKVHESIGNMSSLVHLNLLGCSNLVEFPSDVTGMKGLKELILSDCFKLTRLPQDVRSMTSLIQLLLDRTEITELPNTVFHLTQLEVLSLKDCRQLTSLPDSIKCLTSLRELYLPGTSLETLPCSVGSLTNLEILNLMHCSSITALPESIENLTTLNQLLLTNSSIQQLPDSLCSLSYLRVLSLDRCRSLVQLPNKLGRLASIVELELDHTPIEVLPEEICSLKFVKKLRMNNCTSLVKLPERIGEMSNLNILFIGGAAITELPESIGELENLTWLRLTKCRNLSSLPDSIGNLRSLCILLIEETSVTSLPDTFGLLDSLRTLKMLKSSNDLPKLTVLPTTFCKLSNLEEFNASACGISGKIRDDFSELSKLEVLDFGFNKFDTLPCTLKGLCVLKKLILRHCKDLKVLPPLPPSLEELNAADCHSLESISDLSNLERLQELQLANCSRIVNVPGLQHLKSLRRLFMGGCNASAAAIRRGLSKAALRNLNNLCIPGSEIPDWFCRKAVNFTPHPNLAIKCVIVAVVLSVDIQELDHIRAQVPSIADLQARIIRQDEPIFTTAINLRGLPLTKEEQLYLSRYKDYHPLVSLLRKDDIIQVGWKSGIVKGIELRSWGIHLVFENDDDRDVDEDSFPLTESQQSVSQRLVNFFRSVDQNT